MFHHVSPTFESGASRAHLHWHILAQVIQVGSGAKCLRLLILYILFCSSSRCTLSYPCASKGNMWNQHEKGRSVSLLDVLLERDVEMPCCCLASQWLFISAGRLCLGEVSPQMRRTFLEFAAHENCWQRQVQLRAPKVLVAENCQGLYRSKSRKSKNTHSIQI